MKIIAPSMLSSDFGRLIDEIELINKSNADWFHLDVMDGVFVPNITFGSPVLDIFKNYAEIAKTLNISTRTVHRVLNQNNQQNQKFVLELKNQNIIKKSQLISMRN